ncbi:MAG: antibiotic biosynthesis monooxygenase [Actinobacteria bacterium]|jgi:quinol monooxygenase YgiN|nr:antibiotic biosynthesis monooxygenase [Actinomycetota bacterium]MBT3746319.1 antibiotic biosynthesis monooxygenase [Actinomycetota bacterium]MBT3969638.1 antibiotic biosynthesis monooxygenase [Actinomycetota bacterium]MBT4009832.1 antibiotic biosynthesis monooxygenase [Actinomycetota bacterium]MBT4302817.1 antibiotic biosynthesis monooxygenase [Actinomycetota bacterium]
MIILAGTITCDPEKMEEALTAIRPLMEATQAEEGCIDYALSADSLVPGLIRIYEEWETDEALEVHRKAPHMADFQAQTASFGISGVSLNRFSDATVTKLA